LFATERRHEHHERLLGLLLLRLALKVVPEDLRKHLIRLGVTGIGMLRDGEQLLETLQVSPKLPACVAAGENDPRSRKAFA
jgi:hypothetical protein